MAATLEDFKVMTNLRDLDATEEEQIEKLLILAENMILDYTGGVWNSPRDGSSVLADGRQIMIVRRYFENQRGLTTASVDGASESYDERSYEGMRLTAEDIKSLGRLKQPRQQLGRVSFHRNFGAVW